MQTTAAQLAETFGKCEPPVQEWAEKAAFENLKQRIDSGAAIAGQASTTLTILLAGIGGALTVAAKLFEPGMHRFSWGAAAVCIYLAVLAAILVTRCLTLRAAPTLYNHPANLLVPGYTLAQLRAGELANVELRIGQQIALNNARSAALDRLRYAAIASPLIFGVTLLFAPN